MEKLFPLTNYVFLVDKKSHIKIKSIQAMLVIKISFNISCVTKWKERTPSYQVNNITAASSRILGFIDRAGRDLSMSSTYPKLYYSLLRSKTSICIYRLEFKLIVRKKKFNLNCSLNLAKLSPWLRCSVRLENVKELIHNWKKMVVGWTFLNWTFIDGL